jgi:hypothetical protein
MDAASKQHSPEQAKGPEPTKQNRSWTDTTQKGKVEEEPGDYCFFFAIPLSLLKECFAVIVDLSAHMAMAPIPPEGGIDFRDILHEKKRQNRRIAVEESSCTPKAPYIESFRKLFVF